MGNTTRCDCDLEAAHLRFRVVYLLRTKHTRTFYNRLNKKKRWRALQSNEPDGTIEEYIEATWLIFNCTYSSNTFMSCSQSFSHVYTKALYLNMVV